MAPEWVDEAVELYKELGSYAAVARRVHVSESAVRYQLSARAREGADAYRRKWRQTEKGKQSVAETNRKRQGQKNDHALKKRAICPRCGRERGAGTMWASRTGALGVCRKCSDEMRHEKAVAKWKRIEALWNEQPMLNGAQIAEAIGITEGALRQQINKMRKSGDFDVPRRYRKRGD